MRASSDRTTEIQASWRGNARSFRGDFMLASLWSCYLGWGGKIKISRRQITRWFGVSFLRGGGVGFRGVSFFFPSFCLVLIMVFLCLILFILKLIDWTRYVSLAHHYWWFSFWWDITEVSRWLSIYRSRDRSLPQSIARRKCQCSGKLVWPKKYKRKSLCCQVEPIGH